MVSFMWIFPVRARMMVLGPYELAGVVWSQYYRCMGQNSACCNPTTQMIEPEALSLPKEILTIQTTVPLEPFSEPSPQILQTLAKGEQYLGHHFGKSLSLQSDDLWQVAVARAEGRQTVHGRGGNRGPSGLSGISILYFPNREVFKGETKDSRPVFGVFVFRSGCFYAGEMRGFNAEGHGRFENSDSGYAYEGSWSKSLPHGRGKEEYANGDRFQGELMYGAKFGQGTYHFHSGNLYEGSFYYNQRDGRGRLDYSNGNSYDGEWKLGLFSGHGVFRWANGEQYEGEYVQGRRHGKGKYVFRNGSYYEGGWANGLQEGQGVVHDKFDEVKGVWEQGELIN